MADQLPHVGARGLTSSDFGFPKSPRRAQPDISVGAGADVPQAW